MKKKAVAISYGAATIVNAIALGKGVAFGVDLWTKAELELTDEPQIVEATITSDPQENPLLIKKTVLRVLQRFGLENDFGAKVKTSSNIPIARGLKSSSAAANAVALATLGALGRNLDDLDVVKLGVEAAFDANVTVTGAFDDACASFFGGAVATDNSEREIIKQFQLPKDLTVLFHVPAKKSYTAQSNVNKLQTVKSLVEVAYNEALKGNFWEALTLNGLIYSSALGYNPAIALDALAAGAVAAGLCGKGPAITTVVPKDKVEQVTAALKGYEGEILQANLNHKKAKVL